MEHRFEENPTMIVLSVASLAFAAAITSTTPAATGTASPVTVTAPAAVVAQAGPRHRHDDTLVVERSNASSDDAAIQEQIRLRVLSPALSGDA
jgi:hypothetical protein